MDVSLGYSIMLLVTSQLVDANIFVTYFSTWNLGIIPEGGRLDLKGSARWVQD